MFLIYSLLCDVGPLYDLTGVELVRIIQIVILQLLNYYAELYSKKVIHNTFAISKILYLNYAADDTWAA